jgi:hypothetical protein
MTGLLARLRGWLGSLVGGDGDDGDDADADAEPRMEGNAPTVSHRDDRPLETPDVSPAAAATAGESGRGGDDGDRPPSRDRDAATEPDRDTEAAVDSGPVSIPDAEATAGGEAGGRAGSPTGEGDAATGGTATSDAAGGDATPEADTDDASAEGFECAVCGTAVDDPAHSCPLCRSTEVVPATESVEGEP